MRKIKGLSARLKSCPDTNRAEIDFFSNLLRDCPSAMAQTITLIRVFVAGPSDVRAERDALKAVVDQPSGGVNLNDFIDLVSANIMQF